MLKLVPVRAVRGRMVSCRDCGAGLRPSQSRVRVFSTLEVAAPIKVEADECPCCGRLFPVEGAVEGALARRAATTIPPPSLGRLKASKVGKTS